MFGILGRSPFSERSSEVAQLLSGRSLDAATRHGMGLLPLDGKEFSAPDLLPEYYRAGDKFGDAFDVSPTRGRR